MELVGRVSCTLSVASEVKQQYEDNLKWIESAWENNLVVGSQARILYSNQTGRVKLALGFNEEVQTGKLKVNTIRPLY